MTIPRDQVVTQWLLDADQHTAELNKVYREYRKQEAQEKKLDYVRGKLDKTTEQAARSTDKLAGSTSSLRRAMEHAAGNVLAAGLGKLKSELGDVVRIARDTEDWIGADAQAIDGMRTATAGLISNLQLMRARTRLTTGDFQLNERQLAAVTKAAIYLTRINKEDFSASLDKVTKSVKTGSTRALKELGINVDLLGKANEKTGATLDILVDRFADVDISAENTNERMDQVKNSMENATGAIGSAILRSDALKSAFDWLASGAQSLASGIDEIRRSFSSLTDMEHLVKQMSGSVFLPEAAKRTLREALNLVKEQRAFAAQIKKDNPWILTQAELEKYIIGPARAATAELHRQRAQARTAKTKKPKTVHEKDIVDQLEATAVSDTKLYSTAKSLLKEFTENEDKSTKALKNKAKAAKQAKVALSEYDKVTKEASKSLQEMAVGALGNLVAGMWSAADAAIQSGESFGAAMAKMLKDTLLSIAEQATVKAIFEIAEGLAATASFNYASAAAHYASAATFAAVAAAAGVAGLALSAATAGSSSSASSSSPSASSSTASPSGTGGTEKSKQPVIVNLAIGDAVRKSLSLVETRQMAVGLNREIGKAMRAA